jgi:hypothetical protein
MRPRIHTRPNVLPAKTSGTPVLGEYINTYLKTHRIDGWSRSCIQDMCDFCLQYRYISRSSIGLRVRGYKFGCRYCFEEKKFTGYGKKTMVLPCWLFKTAPSFASENYLVNLGYRAANS